MIIYEELSDLQEECERLKTKTYHLERELRRNYATLVAINTKIYWLTDQRKKDDTRS